MNKSELVSFFRRSLLGREAMGDDQKAYHFQRVSQAVGYAFDNLLAQIKLDDSGKAKIESYYLKHYYSQPVKESNGYRYFGVSDDIVDIGEGRGIWYVQPTGGGAPFPYSHRPHISLFANMAVGEAMNKTTWRFGNITTEKQVVIENIGDSPSSDIREVDYGIVRSFNSYSDDEEVIIPDGRMDVMHDLVRAWLKEGAYVDKTNNNI